MFKSWKCRVFQAWPTAFFCMASVCALSPPASAGVAPSPVNSVQTEMARHLQSEGLPGVVWSLVTPEAGIVTGAAGLRHADKGQAMTSDTRVHVGSVAKAVLAIGVLHLVSTGRLTLDTEVGALLPALHVDNPWRQTDPVRVRHLLEHTAGLDNFRFSQIFSLRAHPDAALAAAPGLATLNVNTRPGSHFVYSNTGYHLLGMVIEAVTNRGYEDYLNASLLRPLGMRDSTFVYTTQAGPGADPRLAMGHFEDGVAHPAVPVHVRPATQFTTTAGDMGRLAQFLMGDGVIDGKPFVARALLADLGGAHGTDAARAGLDRGHGLALATRDRHQVVGDCHPGTMVGFQAMFCLYPRERKAFFFAANADAENADYDRLNKSLIAALQLDPQVPHRSAAPAPEAMAGWSGFYVPAWHAVASLAWVDTVFNGVDVRWDGELLQLAPLQGKRASLRPAGGMLFQAGDRVAPSHVLFVSEGDRVLSDGLRSYRKVPFLHMLWLWASAALGAVGLLYVLLRGLWLLVRGRLRGSGLGLPLASVLVLFVPLPFFFGQSFLQLGDLTMASGLLALATCLLPLGTAWGLAYFLRGRGGSGRRAFDCAALLAAIQWMIVLTAWGMLPIFLWR